MYFCYIMVVTCQWKAEDKLVSCCSSEQACPGSVCEKQRNTVTLLNLPRAQARCRSEQADLRARAWWERCLCTGNRQCKRTDPARVYLPHLCPNSQLNDTDWAEIWVPIKLFAEALNRSFLWRCFTPGSGCHWQLKLNLWVWIIGNFSYLQSRDLWAFGFNERIWSRIQIEFSFNPCLT